MGAANKVVIFLGAQAVGTGNYLGVARQGYGTGSYFAGDPWKTYWDNTRTFLVIGIRSEEQSVLILPLISTMIRT